MISRNSNAHLILSSSFLSVMMCRGGDGIPHLTAAMMSERAHPSLPIHSSAMHHTHTHTRPDRRQVCQSSVCKYTALYYLRQMTSVTLTELIMLKIRCIHVFGHVLLTFMKNRLYDSSNLNINLI